MKIQGIDNMQKFSVGDISVLKNKFTMKPYKSFLAYGGSIYPKTKDQSYISELYHIMLQTIAPGSTRINIVNDIKYFENKVLISSCEQAINFVRLLTTPMLMVCLEGHLGYEVLVKEDFEPSDWLGQDLFMPSYHSGYCAVIARKDAEKMSVFSAKCTESGVYRISRFIFQQDEKGLIKMEYGMDGNLILFEEEVSRNGKYRFVNKSIHKNNVNYVKWSFPIEY